MSAECSQHLPRAVPGHACRLDEAARVLEVRGPSREAALLHPGRHSRLPGRAWGRLQGAAMPRGAWCSNPPVLPLFFTEPGPHTHTTTPHTMLQESVPQRPLILSLKHKGLAAHYPSASCLAWPQEGGGPWPVLQPLRSQRVGTHVGKDFPSKQPGRGLFRGSGLPPSVTDAPAPTQSTRGEASTGSGETGQPLPWGGQAAATLAPRHWVSVFSGGHSLAHGPEAAASELTRILPHSIRTPAPLPPSPARGQ